MELKGEQLLLIGVLLGFVIFAGYVKGNDDSHIGRLRNKYHRHTGSSGGAGNFKLGVTDSEIDAKLNKLKPKPKKPRESIFSSMYTMQKEKEKPILWLYYNDSEVNSRWWADFGSRSSHVIHIPLLNLLYNSIVSKNKEDYRIEVIGGLGDVAKLLGGWEMMPGKLKNQKEFVTLPEEDWIRTAILAKYGGLWVSPSIYCLRPFGILPEDRIVAFGTDDNPLYTGSILPEFRCLWSPIPHHPMFVYWEQKCRGRLEYQLGGRQIRGDSKSDWIELSPKFATETYAREEFSRNSKTGKRIELEDLFAAGTEGRLPFSIPDETIYIVIPYNELKERRMFGWVLRSSEEQLLESDLALSHIMRSSM
jgi:hypothetical protein